MGFGSGDGGAGIIGSAGGLPGDGAFFGGVAEEEPLLLLSAPEMGVTIGPAFTFPVDADVPLPEDCAGWLTGAGCPMGTSTSWTTGVGFAPGVGWSAPAVGWPFPP